MTRRSDIILEAVSAQRAKRFCWRGGELEPVCDIREDVSKAHIAIGDTFQDAPYSKGFPYGEALTPEQLGHYKKVYNGLSTDAARGFADYKESSFDLNKALREHRPMDYDSQKKHESMMTSFGDGIPSRHVVWRGFDLPDRQEFLRTMRRGDRFKDSGYVSTSLDPKVAAAFSGYAERQRDRDDKRHTSTLARITLQPHVHAHYVDVPTHGIPNRGYNITDAEREVILRPGIHFLVEGHSIHPMPKGFSDDLDEGQLLHIIHMSAFER